MTVPTTLESPAVPPFAPHDSHDAPPERDDLGKRRCEADLRQSLYFVEEAQALARVGTWITYLDGPKKPVWSKVAREILGFGGEEEPTLEQYFDLVHPDDRPRVQAIRSEAIERVGSFDLEFRVVRRDGVLRWLHARATVIGDDDGAPSRLLGVFQDVTEQKKTLDQLRESEARYRRIIETTNEGVWTIDAAERTTFVNARMAAILGCAPDDVIGRPVLDFVNERDRATALAELEDRRRGVAGQVEMTLRRNDGTSVWVLVEATPIFDDEGRYDGALAMVSDVTERRHAREALLLSEQRIVRLSECGIIAVAIVDLAGRIHEVNDTYCRMTGYTHDEIVSGQANYTVLTPPEWRQACREAVHQLKESGVATPFEKELLRKDGSRLPVLEGSAMLEGDRCIVFMADLSERHRAQRALRQSEEQLRQAQKMEAIGRLAGGVAHDFNNLLCVILSHTDLILDELRFGDPLRADIGEIKVAGERAAALTRQLLAFSRRQVLEPRVIDLSETVMGMQKMVRRLIGEDVELDLQLAPSLGATFADPGQIEQVIMNLAVNARDAMPKGGKLTIATRDVEIEQAQLDRESIVPGGYVSLTVSDTGEGMDAATLTRIFEPFFTTKDKEKGTGLGLSTVLGIVKQSGGHIAVKSEPGAGASFEILLPRVSAATKHESIPPPPASTRPQENGTILVIEDDEQVRALVIQVLRRAGHHVLEARSPGDALLICEEHAGSIDLLLTDVVMPRLNGPRVAERLKKLRPEMRVLFMSGYPDGSLAPFGILEAGVALLHKPLRPHTLLAKVREALGVPSASDR